MNDEQIKNLLKKDQHIPSKPLNEWSQIQSKFVTGESKAVVFGNKLKLGSLAMAMMICFFIIQKSITTSNSVSNDEIASYLFGDDYFNDMDDVSLYAWID